ncbi:MAG: hypothetical protein ABSA17_07040 [Rhabdochlamydiaceae bacterium]|jgi:hypothetical protein
MNLATHLNVLFSTTIISPDKGSPRDLTYQASRLCMAPLNFFRERLAESQVVTPFLVRPHHRMPVMQLGKISPPGLSAIKVHQWFLAFLLVIPGTVVGVALRVVLMVTSSHFRTQHRLLIDYHLNKENQVINPTPLPNFAGIPSDVWTIIATDLSVQDLGRLARVSKPLNQQIKSIFNRLLLPKAQSLGIPATHQNAEQLLNEKVSFIHQTCFEPVVTSLGALRIFNLPQREFDDSMASITQLFQDKEGPIFGSAGWTKIAFHCEDTLQKVEGLPGKHGILMIEHGQSSFNTFSISWIHKDDLHNSKFNFSIDPSALTSELMTRLIQGEQVQVESHWRAGLAILDLTLALKRL